MADPLHSAHGANHQQDHAAGHAAYLDALEESVNRQIDTDIRVLLDNFKEMIHLSRVRQFLNACT